MFEALLERVALALDRHGIPYMVIGGQAVLLHGEPRLTRDIDITLGADLGRLDELIGVAGELALEVLVDPEEFTRRTFVLPCRDPAGGIRLDFIFSVLPYEREAIGRALAIKMGGAAVRFATAEDLVIHKLIAGRPRDLEDARSVLLKNPGMDLDHIRRVLRDFEATLQEPFGKRLDDLV